MKQTRLLLLLLSAAPLFAGASPNYFFNLPKASMTQTIVFFFILALIILMIGLFELFKVKRQNAAEKSASETRFDENCKKYKIDNEEYALLKILAGQGKTADPNELFESLPAFEYAVDGIVSDALGEDNDYAPTDLEELLQSLRKKLHFSVIDQNTPISSTRNISSGQTVWILGQKNVVLGEAVVTRVREFSFSVRLSAREMQQLPPSGANVRMAFTRKTDGIYGIEVPLVSFDVSTGTLNCRHSLHFKRNQLRHDVRVETDLMITIRCMTSENGEKPDREPFMVKMTDLSGGGIALVSERIISVGDTIIVSAATPKLKLSGVAAKVIATTQKNQSPKILYHAQFININFEKREAIVKFVFNRMRELNQR